MQDGAEREQRSSVIEENIRNLRQDSTTHKLWLIDNESGLLDAYDLLYESKESPRFINFHQQMLQTICVFNKKLIKAVKKLASNSEPDLVLIRETIKEQPLFKQLQRGMEFQRFRKHFNERLHEVLDWVKKCEAKEKTR